MNPITRAIKQLGLNPLAREMDVTYQAIRKWEAGRIPAERVESFERATGYKVSRHDLRPDLWPAADWCRCPSCQHVAADQGMQRNTTDHSAGGEPCPPT